jgi:endonuclease/exonuclease/phosphatase family metal-dependent hydrolase
MKLVTYNTQYCKGKDLKIDVDRVVRPMAEGDIIALQEIERHWERTGDMDQPAEIAKRLPKHHWAYGPYFDADASIVAADGRVTNRRRQFGTMTLSRWPILSSRLHLLPKFKTGSVFCMIAGCLETVIAAPGGKDMPCRIDYVFTTLGLAPRLKSCRIDNAAPGSDHQPVWVEMT